MSAGDRAQAQPTVWLFRVTAPSFVRELAFRLRQQHNDGMAAARELVQEREDDIRNLESEIDSLEYDLMSSKNDLTDAQDRLREMKGGTS